MIPRLSERWCEARNRLFASARFQAFTAAFWPTRGIARRRAAAMFDLCAGFVYSQILQACVRLDLLTPLRQGPASLEHLAEHGQLDVAAARCLLDAAVSLGLLERRAGGRYGLAAQGAVLAAHPAVLAMIEHHAVFYRDLADPVALLRGTAGATGLSTYWAYSGREDATTLPETAVGAYTELMSRSQPLIASEVLAAYPIAAHQCVLDIGGGDGSFLRAIAAAAPELRLMLLDLPAVAAQATAQFARAGLAARTSVHGGDFRVAPLPRGADLVTLVRVLHDHDDGTVRALLKAVVEVLPPGGTLLIAEPMAGTEGALPMGAAYFGFYLLAMGRGRPRTAAELGALLKEAGFVDFRVHPTRQPLQTRVLTARAPTRGARL